MYVEDEHETMSVYRNFLVRSRNDCNGSATIIFLFIVFDLHVALSSVKSSIFVMETQEEVRLHCCRNAKYE